MKITTAYKIVHQNGKSLLKDTLPPEFVVRYKLNEFVEAPNRSLLFVFQELEQAYSFRENKGWPECDIYECEVEEVTKPKRIGALDSLFLFWSSKLSKKSLKEYSKQPPKGTLFAKRVKLVKRVSIGQTY